MKYVFGPVASRRLGLSLGIDPIPRKLCTMDCIYCEVGPTDKLAFRRRDYVPVADILAEVRAVLGQLGALRVPEQSGRSVEFTPLQYVTFSGSGEPTLHSRLGEMIRAVKSMTAVPVAVLTNGTLLFMEEVRRDLLEAGVGLPSLDAATQEVFERVDRPHPRLRIDRVIEGLRSFRREYWGQLWIEVLLVDGVNDGDEEVSRIKAALDSIAPDRVQLNTVVRPPSDSSARPVTREKMEAIRAILGDRTEIVASFRAGAKSREVDGLKDVIRAVVARRPMTIVDMVESLGCDVAEIEKEIGDLQRRGDLVCRKQGNEVFYQARQGDRTGDPDAERSQLR